MPRPALFSIGESIGIEFETDVVLPQEVRALSSIASPTHDASIESDAILDSRTGFIVRNMSSRNRRVDGSRVTIGTEIVSSPVDTEIDDPEKMVWAITKWLSEYGEPATSTRSGIHIHVGLGSTNLDMLKSALLWGRRLEALFFSLAGNGYAFRGATNDSAYCRPITRCGPPCIRYGGGYARIFDIDHMLKAKNSREFWYMYGGTTQSNVQRYVPHRYTWLNLYSLPAHGTLEFRTWNKTLNASQIVAEIALCKKFTSAVIKSIPTDGQEHSAFDIPILGLSGIVDDLNYIVSEWGLSDKTANVLAKILETTPPCVLNEGNILSHINYSNPWVDGNMPSYNPVEVDDVRRASITTIHTLRGEPERN